MSVYGHRGASALLPEHTLASYAQAIADGADYIEPDLVMTKDGVMVARHENEIGGTTDVASHPEFASRRTSKVIDGQKVDGWFTEDFTLAELKTLYARERLPELRSTAYDGQFRIASLDEILAFLVQQAGRANRGIGLVPEIKHPTYFQSIGLPMEDNCWPHCVATRTPMSGRSRSSRSRPPTCATCAAGSAGAATSGCCSCCGRAIPSRRHRQGRRHADLRTDDDPGLKDIAGYADGIGPELRSIIPLDAKGALGTPTSLVRDAHAAGLMVIPYTFRPENHFQPSNLRKGADSARNAEDRSPRCGLTWRRASMRSSPMTRRSAASGGWDGRGGELSDPRAGHGPALPGPVCSGRCQPWLAHNNAPTKVGHYRFMRLPASGTLTSTARFVRAAERITT